MPAIGESNSSVAPTKGRRPWWSRATRGCVRVVASLFVTIIVVILVIGWQVAHGPIELDFLKPYVEQTLSELSPEVDVAIGSASVAFDPDDTGLDIRARGVRLVGRDRRVIATLPEVALSFSLRLAVRGVMAPTRISINEPRLRVRRSREGSFSLGIVGEGDAAPEVGKGLLDDLLQPPGADHALGALREIAVRGASVTVDDELLGVTWAASRVGIAAYRGRDGVFGNATLSTDIGGRRADVQADFRYVLAQDRFGLDLAFADLEPQRFAGLDPALSSLRALQVPFGGSVKFSANVAGRRVEDVRLELALGRGSIVQADLPNGTIPVTSGTIKADYDPVARRVNLTTLRLDLDGPVLTATGTADGVDLDDRLMQASTAGRDDIKVAADVAVTGLAANDLEKFWPNGVAKGGRAWVTENVRDGTADQANVKFHLRLPQGDASRLVFEDLAGTLSYRDLTVHYLRPLPPVKGVAGTARMTLQTFELTPSGGALENLKLTGGTIKLIDLDTPHDSCHIDLAVAGPLRDVMSVIDSKPFEYAKEIGIDPQRVSGTADARLLFGFPLIRTLRFDQVTLGVKAQLKSVAIQKLVLGADVTEGELVLDLDRAGLKIQGGAKLAGTPGAVSLTNVFKPKDGVRTRVSVWATLDAAARRRLDLDILPDMVDGPVGVDAVIAIAGKRVDATVALDLLQSTMTVKQLGFQKAPGVAATARFVAELQNERLQRVRDILVRSSGFEFQGAVTAGATTTGPVTIQRIEAKRLVSGATDVAGVAVRVPEGGWRIDATGATLDITTPLKESSSSDNGAKDGDDLPPLVVDARFARLIVGPRREARSVNALLNYDGKHWQIARVDADLPGEGSHKLQLRFGQAGGDRRLSIVSNDFGGTLKLLGVSEDFVGGQVNITGQADDSGKIRVLRGHAEGSDFKLVNAPLFTRIFALTSLTSLGSLLSGEGVPFTRLTGDFVMSDGKLALTDTRAFGGAIGFTVNGGIDLDAQTMDLDGTVVPAYTLNNMLGYIPLLGNLLQGGEGQGLFAANFRATGPLVDPKVSINPLSMLAPGFLRNLFRFDAGDGSPSSAPGKPNGQK